MGITKDQIRKNVEKARDRCFKPCGRRTLRGEARTRAGYLAMLWFPMHPDESRWLVEITHFSPAMAINDSEIEAARQIP